jgi:hypothetical protein
MGAASGDAWRAATETQELTKANRNRMLKLRQQYEDRENQRVQGLQAGLRADFYRRNGVR